MLNTAILFLIFNRPDTTQKVFDAIRKAKPPRLYIASDGARADRSAEAALVSQAREVVSQIDWPCEVYQLFRTENLGCKKAVSEAISWFFDNEECGIILEDDCLPHPDFFPYCESLLTRYKDVDQVWAITGDNFQGGHRRGDADYYFSKYFHCWGWATWRRSWQQYDVNLNYWPEWRDSEKWLLQQDDKTERAYWEAIFNKTFLGQINTWDYQCLACIWKNNGLVITPNVNLVSNIGFGPGATHTLSSSSEWAGMAVGSLEVKRHPRVIAVDLTADNYTFDHHFGGQEMRLPSSIRFLLRAARYIKRVFIK